jgi:hypothetical protein
VFTKEEVKIIKATIELAGELDALVASTLRKVSPNAGTISKVLSILDSPRPRPKVPMGLLEVCSFIDFADKESWQNAARIDAISYGFDVETRSKSCPR